MSEYSSYSYAWDITRAPSAWRRILEAVEAISPQSHEMVLLMFRTGRVEWSQRVSRVVPHGEFRESLFSILSALSDLVDSLSDEADDFMESGDTFSAHCAASDSVFVAEVANGLVDVAPEEHDLGSQTGDSPSSGLFSNVYQIPGLSIPALSGAVANIVASAFGEEYQELFMNVFCTPEDMDIIEWFMQKARDEGPDAVAAELDILSYITDRACDFIMDMPHQRHTRHPITLVVAIRNGIQNLHQVVTEGVEALLAEDQDMDPFATE